MRTYLLVLVGAVILALLVGVAEVIGQLLPNEGKGSKEKSSKGKGPKNSGSNQEVSTQAPVDKAPEEKAPKGPPDEVKAILDQIKEAYKAPFEVHEDVLKELRKSYQQPSLDREAKIFKELRRLYQLTPEQEMAILREIRIAYEQPSAEQEGRIFQEISKAERLPPGAVAPSIQVEQTRKIFLKLDLNGDGVLGPEEMSESLRQERARWDTNGNGSIDLDEYWAFYQGRLRSLAEQVASGQIELKSGKGGSNGNLVPMNEGNPRPVVYRGDKLPAGLPAWFTQFDAEGDGQIGLYEWKKTGRPFAEFDGMDRNGDGFITVPELLYSMSQQSGNQVGRP